MDKTQTQVYNSLVELINQEVAEKYIIDTCATGQSFLTFRGIGLNQSFARYNNLSLPRLRESIRTAEIFFDFLNEFPQVSTSKIVLEELERKEVKERRFLSNYGVPRERGRNGYKKSAEHPKQRKLFERLINLESKAKNILKGRMVEPSRQIQEIVIGSTRYNRNNENVNDEIVVSDAINYANSTKKGVAIITRDFRFSSILRLTQKALHKSYIREDLMETLSEGNVSVILGLREGFRLDYCSQDFANY